MQPDHHHHDHPHDHPHDLGLAHDLHQLQRGLTRRKLALGALAGLPLGLTLPGHAPAQSARCPVLPSETAGPFPANGAGRFIGSGPNALALSGIVRSDIRPGIAGANATAGGVVLKLQLTLVNSGAACAPLGGLAVYLWQCDREGRYSMYSPGVQDQNYLRGVQASAADGSVNFTTVVPGCYPGRMPHFHLEVYRSLDLAGARAQRLKTSQLALPRAACEAVYANAPGYAVSAASLRGLSMADDGVFGDGVEQQLLALRGGVAQGFAAALTLGLGA